MSLRHPLQQDAELAVLVCGLFGLGAKAPQPVGDSAGALVAVLALPLSGMLVVRRVWPFAGRVIAAAATIMVVVFAAFVFGGQRVVAEIGLSLAAGVALDAFILRMIPVPAVMHLFGSANWWLPGRLDRRLPHLSVEAPESAKDAKTDQEKLDTVPT